MGQRVHAVWQVPRSRKWVAMMRNYVIGAFLVVALLSAIAFALNSFGHDAYKGVAIAAMVLATAAICLGPFMRAHLEDVSVLPRVFELFKQREGSHPVKIKVTLDDVEIGRDYGVVEFGGGQLVFAGLRTSFNFTCDSVRVVNWTTLYADTELLFVPYDSERLVLSIDSISRVDPDDYYSLTPNYKKAIKAWLNRDGAESLNEVWPPNKISFRSDLKADLGQFVWLGFAHPTWVVTEWLSNRDEPYRLFAYLVPVLAVALTGMYTVSSRRKHNEFIKKHSLPSNANLSQ